MKGISIVKVVKKIVKKGYLVFNKSGKYSKKWSKAHEKANRIVLKERGGAIAKRVNKIKISENELLGTHTKSGTIIISKKVPKQLRSAIALHEKIEHELMTGKKITIIKRKR